VVEAQLARSRAEVEAGATPEQAWLEVTRKTHPEGDRFIERLLRGVGSLAPGDRATDDRDR
jgi:hypothetical protein